MSRKVLLRVSLGQAPLELSGAESIYDKGRGTLQKPLKLFMPVCLCSYKQLRAGLCKYLCCPFVYFFVSLLLVHKNGLVTDC